MEAETLPIISGGNPVWDVDHPYLPVSQVRLVALHHHLELLLCHHRIHRLQGHQETPLHDNTKTRLQMVPVTVQNQLRHRHCRLLCYHVHLVRSEYAITHQTTGCNGLWSHVTVLWLVLWRSGEGLRRGLLRQYGCTYRVLHPYRPPEADARAGRVRGVRQPSTRGRRPERAHREDLQAGL